MILEKMQHEVVEARDGLHALDLAAASRPELILSDILMPRMDGFALCRQLQKNNELRHVPFVFVTAAYSESKYRHFAEEVGATDVLLKPFEPDALRQMVSSMLQQDRSGDATQRMLQLSDVDFHARHAEVVSSKLEEELEELELTNRRLISSEKKVRGLLDAMIRVISKMIEYRDPYTVGHERRVGDLAAVIGEKLGLVGSAVDGLRIAGYVHDVGKIAAPSEILSKPSRLTAAEFELVKSHSVVGHDILSGVDFPWPLAEITLQHHERLDGSGYPSGLAGEAICLEARIIAVADVVEAMSSHRPYRPSVGLDKALEEISAGRGRIYDASVVDACLSVFNEGGFRFS